jgi:hypothetical protein
MGALSSLENSLDGMLGSKAPVKMPENGKKVIAEWLPWISLALGVLTLWSAYAVYHWAHVASAIVDYANSLSKALGGTGVSASRWSIGLWVGLVVLVIEGVLYLAAFPATKDRKKSGWDLLFYAALINIVYGVVILFTDYGGVGNFVMSLVGSVIGLWVLFQIRSVYTGGRSPAKPAEPAAGSSS